MFEVDSGSAWYCLATGLSSLYHLDDSSAWILPPHKHTRQQLLSTEQRRATVHSHRQCRTSQQPQLTWIEWDSDAAAAAASAPQHWPTAGGSMRQLPAPRKRLGA